MEANTRFIIVVTIFCVVVLPMNCAYAYLDPGTGSMIVQAVIAAIAAVSVSIGVFRRQVASFLGRLFRREKRTSEDSDG